MLDLFAAEVRRTWLLARRYPLDFLSGMAMLVITFYAIFLGASYLSGPTAQFGTELDSLIVGYCLWSIARFSVNGIAVGLQTEAMTGTLEQVFLSPFGGLRVILTRAVAGLGINLAVTAALLVVLTALTGHRLSFPPALVLPLAMVPLASYGLGLLLATTALLAKRAGGFLRLSQFLLLFLVMAPIETFAGSARALGYFLPVAPAAAMLRDLMTRDLPFDPAGFSLALANGLGYLLVGLLVFRLAERQARDRGLLGQY